RALRFRRWTIPFGSRGRELNDRTPVIGDEALYVLVLLPKQAQRPRRRVRWSPKERLAGSALGISLHGKAPSRASLWCADSECAESCSCAQNSGQTIPSVPRTNLIC